MYRYQKHNYKIPPEDDGRIKILPSYKERIRHLYNILAPLVRSSTYAIKKIAEQYEVSSDTIRRVVFPAVYQKHNDSAKARMKLKRKAATQQEKQEKNKQNRATIKKRIQLCKQYILNKLKK